MTQKLPLIKVKGKPADIGWQHGLQIKNRIEEAWRFYSQVVFGGRMEALKRLGNQYLEAIYSFSEGYGNEIEAIAEASGHQSWEISALNARTEILQRLLEENPVGECTAAYLPGKRILGQNWDWIDTLESLIVLMEIEREDGHKILQLAEPGIIGKIGFNSKGVGVCFNFISGGASRIALPIHILVRVVLDGGDINDITAVFEKMPHGTSNNILMADDKGRFIDIEFCGEKMTVVTYDDPVPLHTNHYLSDFAIDHDADNDVAYPSSCARYGTARKLLNNLRPDAGPPELKAVLMDQSHDQYPICAPYTLYFGVPIGTVSSVVMDLPNRRMEISAGNPKRNEYNTFVLD